MERTDPMQLAVRRRATLRSQVTSCMGEVETEVAVAEMLALFALDGGPGGH